MSIKLAKKIGFCFGVRRAVAMAEAALKTPGAIYSLGSIIHNKQVVDVLSKKGLRVIKDIGSIRKGTVVASSHGISPKTKDRITRKGLAIIDTTCPFVLKAQNIARSLGKRTGRVLIVGDRGHPEVKALIDFCPNNSEVVKGKAGAARLKISRYDIVSVISQTTQSEKNFNDVIEIIAKRKPESLRIYKTICQDAGKRQRSAALLARSVDVMLVIGGKDSANTKRLHEVCRDVSKKSYWVETEAGVKKIWFKPGYVVGIASGASTPGWVIKRVVEKVKKIINSKHE